MNRPTVRGPGSSSAALGLGGRSVSAGVGLVGLRRRLRAPAASALRRGRDRLGAAGGSDRSASAASASASTRGLRGRLRAARRRRLVRRRLVGRDSSVRSPSGRRRRWRSVRHHDVTAMAAIDSDHADDDDHRDGDHDGRAYARPGIRPSTGSSRTGAGPRLVELAQAGDDPLEVVLALAGHADRVALDLRLHLGELVADQLGDLLRERRRAGRGGA